MFGAVSGALLWDLAKRGGAMQQLDLLEPTPFIELPLEAFSSITVKYSWYGDGLGIMHSKDHPAFTEIREKLAAKEYIKMERNWNNGDVVTKPFYINRKLFDVGEKFVCAPAHHYSIKKFMESDEYDRRNPDHFMYGGDFCPKMDLQS